VQFSINTSVAYYFNFQGLTVGLCPAVDSGEGNDPMDPYTFTPMLAGGLETRTSVRLSASSVKYGHEKGFRFTVAVAAIYGGCPGGKVVISDGKKALCAARVVNRKGYCALSSNTEIPVGKYAITVPTTATTTPPPQARRLLPSNAAKTRRFWQSLLVGPSLV
jgi:hypothetical protein